MGETKGGRAVLVDVGIHKDQIRHYGFAFEGKTVLIGSGDAKTYR